MATVVVATGQRRTNAEIQMRQPVEDFFPPDWRIFMFYCLLLRSLTSLPPLMGGAGPGPRSVEKLGGKCKI